MCIRDSRNIARTGWRLRLPFFARITGSHRLNDTADGAADDDTRAHHIDATSNNDVHGAGDDDFNRDNCGPDNHGPKEEVVGPVGHHHDPTDTHDHLTSHDNHNAPAGDHNDHTAYDNDDAPAGHHDDAAAKHPPFSNGTRGQLQLRNSGRQSDSGRITHYRRVRALPG